MNKLLVGMVAFLSAVVLCVILNLTAEIVIPLVIAWFLMQMFRPVLALGGKLRLPELVNVCIVFAIIFLVLAAFSWFASQQIVGAELLFRQYGAKLSDLTSRVLETLQIPAESFSVVNILMRYVGNISGGLFNFFSQFALILIFLMFMLLETAGFDKKIDRAFPGRHADKIKHVLETISGQVSRYLGVMALVSFVTGALFWAVLRIIGVELAAGWGVLAFFLNFIPNVGPVIATIPPVVMAMLQFEPVSAQSIAVLAILGTIQMVTGNIVAPKMLGSSLGLSPVVVMLSLLVWGLILGLPGAILSVPIASIVKIICENVPALRPIAVVMGTDAEPAEGSKPEAERGK